MGRPKQTTCLRGHKTEPGKNCVDCLRLRSTQYRERTRLVRAERVRDFYYQSIEYKGGRCVDCGFAIDLRALQFDHREGRPTKNERGVATLLHTATWERIRAELDKCDLVCANCHCIRTATRRLQSA